jgi:N-acetyl-gamma-glutamyl-phosphate reductase
MYILIVGGTFNQDGGRPSGYFGKLTVALAAVLPRARLQSLNGGSFESLQSTIDAVAGVSHLLWFCDVPNEWPKLLPVLKTRYPGMVLVSSKNNRKQLYTREELYERMRRSRSELLVEFGDGAEGVLVASVLAAQGEVLLESCASIEEVTACLATQFLRLADLRFPLAKMPYRTRDADSFQHRDFSTETELPLGGHPGAFGVVRRNHIHEGVDLYGQPGDAVLAMEAGIVICQYPFTGAAAGSPWWEDTACLMVQGASGVLNYGEITVGAGMHPGRAVCAGEQLGVLARVLRNDKGRPMTMLHLERYITGTREPIREWTSDEPQPQSLCDPSALLVAARARLCIVGERGHVSQALQYRLEQAGTHSVVVVSTDSVLKGQFEAELATANLVVLCTQEFSSPKVLERLPAATRVLDISPAFRTDPAWVYGMAELPGAPARIRHAQRVANPGCFATAAVLLLAPLVRAGLLAPDTPVYLDGTGGYSTGGAMLTEKFETGHLSVEAVFGLTREHRHIAEIKQYAGLTGPVVFSPKIASVSRGIRMQVPLFGLARETVLDALAAAYAGTDITVESACPAKIPVDEWANRFGASVWVYEQAGGAWRCVQWTIWSRAPLAVLWPISP